MAISRYNISILLHISMSGTRRLHRKVFPSVPTRTLRQVNIENAAEADRIFSMLMGDDVPPRREFIEKNAHYANIDA